MALKSLKFEVVKPAETLRTRVYYSQSSTSRYKCFLIFPHYVCNDGVKATILCSDGHAYMFNSCNSKRPLTVLSRDRFRTMVNVMGDALATGIMAHICRKDFVKEGEQVSAKKETAQYDSGSTSLENIGLVFISKKEENDIRTWKKEKKKKSKVSSDGWGAG